MSICFVYYFVFYSPFYLFWINLPGYNLPYPLSLFGILCLHCLAWFSHSVLFISASFLQHSLFCLLLLSFWECHSYRWSWHEKHSQFLVLIFYAWVLAKPLPRRFGLLFWQIPNILLRLFIVKMSGGHESQIRHIYLLFSSLAFSFSGLSFRIFSR